MAFIAAVVAFLALLSCAGAQAPAPAPLQQKTPVPVQQSAPTPAPPQEAAPAPAPLQQKTPVPVQQSAPTPAPLQEAAPAPMLSGAPPEGSPGTDAPAPSSDCLNALANMSACLTYVMAGSNQTVPDEGCCPALAGLVESNPICLCELFGESNSFGIDLDMAKAVNLPSVCKISTPPLSTCALLGIPVGAPGISQIAPVMSPSGQTSTESATPPESSKSSSSFRISVAVFLIGLWAGVAAIF
ncbi:hypothetical protein AAC387_Pa02g4731 [Persea americana]